MNEPLRRWRSSSGLGRKLAQVQGASTVPAARAGHQCRRPADPDAVPVHTCRTPNVDELNQWAPKIYEKLKTLPQLTGVATDQQTGGATLTLTIDRDQAARFGIQPQLIDDTLYDAFGERQVTQYFTQVNSYHVIMEVLPEAAEHPAGARAYLHQVAADRPAGAAEHAGEMDDQADHLPVHQSPGPVSGGDAELQSGARRRAGRGGDRDPAGGGANSACRPRSPAVPGQCAGVPGLRCKSEPFLVAAAIIVIYLILGMLYESYIHPLTILSTLPSAGVGALLMLMAFGFDFSVIALIGVILLIGIVKKNGIMMVDFAIAGERERGLASRRRQSARHACCASGRS